jgi:hypothetical protein
MARIANTSDIVYIDHVTELNEALGDLIRRKRRQRGWRQEDLAQKLGVSQGLVSVWEKGKAMPTCLGEVGDVLGFTGEEMMTVLAQTQTDDPVVVALSATERIDPKVRNALLTLYRNARDRGDDGLVAAAVGSD